VEKPNNQDPHEWAKFNEETARLICEMGGRCSTVEMERMAIRVDEMPEEMTDLLLAVNRAASELQGGGERENRISLQLLTALARFEAAR
jgi:hypothetical protein